jgi:hypothetical protein
VGPGHSGFSQPQPRKGWGSGGTPRNTGSSYCFLCALLIMIFASVFLLYFWEVLNDCVFLISFVSLNSFSILLFYYVTGITIQVTFAVQSLQTEWRRSVWYHCITSPEHTTLIGTPPRHLSFPPFSLATDYHREKHFYLNSKASPLPKGRRPLDSGRWPPKRGGRRIPPTTPVPRPLFPHLRHLRSGFGPPPLLRPSPLPAGTDRRPSKWKLLSSRWIRLLPPTPLACSPARWALPSPPNLSPSPHRAKCGRRNPPSG